MSTLLEPEEIWSAVRRKSRHALETGALVPLSTSVHVLEEQGMRFAVRRVERMARKEAAAPSQQNPADPFAPPYEPALHVGAISDRHVALLNKFNVLDDHLLIVTRDYAPQTGLLNEADFAAMLRALAPIDGLAFYNGGTEAGASQRHKHLQVVPLPLASEVPRIPFVPCFEEAAADRGVASHTGLPFAHAVTAMPVGWREAPDEAAAKVTALYRALWRHLGHVVEEGEQPVPYNLMATRDWLWLVPRSREGFQGIAVNSLGFAGGLLVRDAVMHGRLEEIGPLRVLSEVTAG